MNSVIIPFPNGTNFKFFMENNVDGFIIGIKGFSENFNHYINKSDLENICKMLKEKNKKVYIMLNKMYFNNEINELESLLDYISKIDIDAVIFSDMAILNIVRDKKLVINLIWGSKLTTNINTIKFLEKRGVNGFILSSEITIDEQIDISSNCKSICGIKLFGFNNMATSSRKLISNYFKYANIDKKTNKKYYIKEKNSDEYYPIIQSDNTNFFSSKILNGILEYQKILNKKINNIFIILDDYMIPESTFYNVIEAFTALKNFSSDSEFAYKLKEVVDSNNFNNTYDGFLNKKTIFKVKINE